MGKTSPFLLLPLLSAVSLAGCGQNGPRPQRSAATLSMPAPQSAGGFAGFDRNDYPGDGRLAELHRHFAFSGYWLNNPPGARVNTWQGKRPQLLKAGFGFLVLYNGRLDAQIKDVQIKDAQSGTAPTGGVKLTPAALGQQDAAAAIAAARREGFPAGTILFLDQEEGGRLLPEQSAYFFAWTEAVAASAFRPGAYLSGQSAPDGTGPDGKPLSITTAQDVREHIASDHLHPVTLWVAQDTCPPSPGCTATPPPLRLSGTAGAEIWQYAQSPRRPERTRSCAQTYGQSSAQSSAQTVGQNSSQADRKPDPADQNCYAGLSTDLFLDLNVADSADPSHGR